MKIKDYALLDFEQAPSANAGETYYAVTMRSRKKVYLYDRDMALAEILDLERFGISDKRKQITVQDRTVEVADGEMKSLRLSFAHEVLIVWDETDGLCFYDLKGRQQFRVSGECICAAIHESAPLLWTTFRMDAHHVKVGLMNFQGSTLAEIVVEDPYEYSLTGLETVPEKEQIVLSFGAGQDGSQDYVLRYKTVNQAGEEKRSEQGKQSVTQNDTGAVYSLEIVQTLPPDTNFIFCLPSRGKAVLLDYYSEILYLTDYPELNEISRFEYPEDEDIYPGELKILNENTLILCNSYDQRYYLLDLTAMKLREEITVDGYEPASSEILGGEIISDIVNMEIQKDRLFIYFSKGTDGDRKTWVVTCKMDALQV